MMSAMGRLYILFALADLAVLVVALIDCLASDEYEIRALPKVVWVFIILLFSPLGGIIWFVAGRPQHATAGGRREVWRPGAGFPEPSRPAQPSRSLAPDDDPEFLRNLARTNREDEEMLRSWEADLRRREEELKRHDRPDEAN
jgi:Phospholipase_D-nuclease N-terminal